MSGYSQQSRYYNGDTTDDLIQPMLYKDNYNYDTIIVSDSESGRLDLISFRVYNTPVLWWRIARFNAIINPETVIAGTQLKIPRL